MKIRRHIHNKPFLLKTVNFHVRIAKKDLLSNEASRGKDDFNVMRQKLTMKTLGQR
jgi:hypothetical protein